MNTKAKVKGKKNNCIVNLESILKPFRINLPKNK